MSAARDRYLMAGFASLFVAAALLVQWHAGAFTTDRGQTGDEAAHFVTSLMLADYLKHPGNPLAFARDYYVHLPRVAIGHWPPFFEGLQALAFLVFGGTNGVAMALQAAILGLMAGLPAALMARHHGLLAGLLAGLVIFCGRFALFLLDTAMADNLLGLLVFLSAWSWSRFYRQPGWGRAMLAAAAFIAAILTKGTAIGLVLLPLFHVALRRDWLFLFRRECVAACAAILLLTVPWYALTYRLAANGWNYSWGGFTLIALPFFLRALVSDFGIPCTIGFLYGAWRVLRLRDVPPDLMVFALAAIVQFVFLLLVPADLQNRYLVPVYPCATMVAVWGLGQLAGKLLPRRAAFSAGLTAVLVLLSIAQGFRPPHVESFRTGEALAHILPSRNPLILISGSARFEGAMIATIAQADRGRFLYALRASKFLSSSSFMGGGYAPRFTDAEGMKAWLRDNGIGWVVIDDGRESMQYAHNRMLLSVLAADPQNFRLAWRGERADGATSVFRAAAADGLPRGVAALVVQQAPSGTP